MHNKHVVHFMDICKYLHIVKHFDPLTLQFNHFGCNVFFFICLIQTQG